MLRRGEAALAPHDVQAGFIDRLDFDRAPASPPPCRGNLRWQKTGDAAGAVAHRRQNHGAVRNAFVSGHFQFALDGRHSPYLQSGIAVRSVGSPEPFALGPGMG